MIKYLPTQYVIKDTGEIIDASKKKQRDDLERIGKKTHQETNENGLTIVTSIVYLKQSKNKQLKLFEL